MEISPGFAVFLMMNNYFHDVATALLAASGAALVLLVKRYGSVPDDEAREYFARVYASMKSLARFTLYWVLLSGIPRTIYFRSFEWRNAIDHSQIPALIVKHLLALLFIVLGAALWAVYSKRARAIIEGSS